jgi:DNA invertase Pin-like site-specific DNA recombinase
MADRKPTAQDLEREIRKRIEAQLRKAKAEGTLHEAELAPQGIKVAVGTRIWWRSGWREHRKGRRPTFDRQAILAALDTGATITTIARRFGCSRTRVYQIRNARDRGVRNTR